MRILYVASDQVVPGSTGGSVHVLEVARGLAARGHEVHVAVHHSSRPPTEDGVLWHRTFWLPDHRVFRLRARGPLLKLARGIAPDAVIERYYNFGGEGILAAEQLGVPSILEVNSPVVDHEGSLKELVDFLLIVRPFKRWRESLCKRAKALISPLVEIVPPFARHKTRVVTWGANVDLFEPGRRSASSRAAMGAPDGAMVVLFSGSFRPWHGVRVFEEAARLLKERNDIYFVLAGGASSGDGRGYNGRRLGAVAYERMPEVVASSDIGVAPYETARLSQLKLGFYWSPLKIFEYMASGLPTVTIPTPPLTEIVREGEEGLHFREGDAGELAKALERLASDRPLRVRMGESARRRVVERYSWARHCEQIEGLLQGVLA